MTDSPRTEAPGSGPDAMMGAAQLPADIALDPQDPQVEARSLTSDAWRELRRRPSFWFSIVLIAIFVLMAAFPQLFSQGDPRETFNVRMRPSSEHWFGTDGQGYDIYARTIYGARASILVGIFATLFTTVIGGAIGVLAAYLGGWLDAVVSRITDVFFAIPLLLHRERGDAVLPRDRPRAARGVVGRRDRRGAGLPAQLPAHPLLPEPLPEPVRPGIHHARRRSPGRVRPEVAVIS